MDFKGFNTWNQFGCEISEQLIKEVADAFVTTGLAAKGYTYVNIDDCWQASSRDSNGNLVPNPERFPSGMKALADYVKSKGLKLGIYSDVGTSTCAGTFHYILVWFICFYEGFPGSYGYFQQVNLIFINQISRGWYLVGQWLGCKNICFMGNRIC